MSFLKKVSTNMARAKQVAMAKIGQSEATVDPQFNQLETMFKEQYSKMKKLTKYVQNYQSAVADLGNAQQGMSQMIIDQYDSTDAMYSVAAKLRDEASVRIEQLRDQMEKYYAENFYQPIERYLTQYKIIEERISERNTRLVDMDRYNGEVKALMSRTDTVPTKLQIAQEKATGKSAEYAALNEELIQDIQKLINDRSRFFDALFANLVQGQTEYLTGSAQALGAIDACFQNINRTSVRNWPRTITDPAQSAFRGATALEVCGEGQSSPGQSAGQPPMGQPPMGQPMGQAPPMANSSFDPNASPGISLQKQAEPPKPAVVKARALYPFQGQDATELTFQFNEEITVLRQGGEWWEGELNGRRGLFPSNYVKLV